MIKYPRLVFVYFVLNLTFGKLPSVMMCGIMSSVYSLSTTVEITFILLKLYLKKSTKKAMKLFKLHLLLYVKKYVTYHLFFTHHSQKYFIKAFYYLLLLVATYH